MVDSLKHSSSASIISKLFIILITRIFFVIVKAGVYYGPDKLYYKASVFSMRNTNVTFVGSKYVGTSPEDPNAIVDLGKSIAVICQADMINRKVTNSSIDGIMNIVFSDYIDDVGSGQQTVANLLGNNFYYYSNNSRTDLAPGVWDVTGFFNLGVFGTAKINSYISNYYGLPAINSGDAARTDPDNLFIGVFEPDNRTFFEFLQSETFNSFNAVLQLTKYFNWSLVGNLFEANSYGYNRQRQVQSYSTYSNTPIFTCGFLVAGIDPVESFEAVLLDTFCTCISNKNTIEVIILWMSTSIAVSTIAYLQSTCDKTDKLTFVISNDFQAPFEQDSYSSATLQYTLQLRSNGPWDYQKYIAECEADASPAAKPVLTASIAQYYRIAYNCTTSDVFPQCPQSIKNRTELCKCNGNEFNIDPFASKYFFTSDMISGYAYALNLLQNNCSWLSQMNREHEKEKTKNFCALNYFGPEDLAFAMRFINYTGYTGPIYFPPDILRRAVKSYYLYMNNTLTGVLAPSGPTINTSLIHWINDKAPVSEIVPQNPDLSYPVVAVFFSIAIAELIVCCILIVLYLMNFDNIIIRRNAPYVSFVMLIGVALIAMSQITISLPNTDGLCTVALYFYRFGICFLISGLVVKHYRIHRIFSNRLAVAIKMPESKLITYMAIATFIYIGFITVFVCVFGFDAVLKTSSYDQFYQYVNCAINNTVWNVIFSFVVQLTIIFALIFNLYLAWLTRKVKSECSESGHLAAFSIILMASYIIFIPVSATLGESVDSAVLRIAIDDELLTIIAISALSILFIPKIWEIYSIKRKERRHGTTD